MNALSPVWSLRLRSLLAASAVFCVVGVASAATDEATEAAPPTNEAEAEHTTSYAALQERENQARQRFAEALSTLRSQGETWFEMMGTSSDAWSAHDALLEGVIRLQRGDRMAWVPSQCALLGTGAIQFIDARGINRLNMPSAQLEATQMLNLASQCDTEVLGSAAMRSVGMALSDMREHGTERRLVTALSLYAATNDRVGFKRGDLRLMIPFFEALLTVGEGAGLERALQGVQAGRPSMGQDLLARYEKLAHTAPTADLRVNPPEGCTPTVAGERVRGRTVTLRSGSHAVGCVDGAQHRFHYSSASTDLFPMTPP